MKKESVRMSLVFGGIGSGKSEFAEEMIEELHQQRVSDFYYFTPAPEPEDDEMREKVEVHRGRRPGWLTTVECGTDPASALDALSPGDIILIDSLGTLLSRFMAESADSAIAETERQLRLIADTAASGLQVILVSEEVGLSPVALTEAGRLFQKGMGRINRLAAELSDEAYFITAGIPQKIK